ncbi:hypothetical protein [Chitinophaga eiseniae]|nr:hypothetical protein [Chitinophaga eiseniae]
MLKFIKDHKIITEQELETIKFTHEVRNAVYHRGENDHQKIELALLIYFALLTKSINKWGKVSMPGHTSRPGYYYIDFTANPTEDHKKSTLTTPDYFEASLKTILAKWQIAKQLNLTAQKLIISQIEAIEKTSIYKKRECRGKLLRCTQKVLVFK